MAHMLGQDLMASIDASICDHEGHHFFTYEATNETQGLLCCYDQWLVEDLWLLSSHSSWQFDASIIQIASASTI